jgi:hypothetical protein
MEEVEKEWLMTDLVIRKISLPNSVNWVEIYQSNN